MRELAWIVGGGVLGFALGLVALFPLFGWLMPGTGNDGTGFLGVVVGTAAGGLAGWVVARRAARNT